MLLDQYVWLLWASAFLILWNPIYPSIIGMFAIGFGMYWSGVYKHFTWKKLNDTD